VSFRFPSRVFLDFFQSFFPLWPPLLTIDVSVSSHVYSGPNSGNVSTRPERRTREGKMSVGKLKNAHLGELINPQQFGRDA